ncbi:hypothetical protein KQX54_019149 [Cotesia glomerata]|uniref:Uncharacterized protein n=1 Tax=Cotesia glomerata TaxID=32391 RepID=A0AAV7IJY1_COTGL|nr:hypothetical protein KQX54_019149 [Cotesia glomerata]
MGVVLYGVAFCGRRISPIVVLWRVNTLLFCSEKTTPGNPIVARYAPAINHNLGTSEGIKTKDFSDVLSVRLGIS